MLELPSQIVPPGVKNEIFSLKLNEIIPIITHPEHNPIVQKDIDILYEFVHMGALIQVTAMSITGDFGGIAMQCAERLLRHRLVHVIASDAYSSNSRPSILSQAVEAAAEILRSYDDAGRMGKKRSLL
jgi:protein-tyrosine phosphatase